MSPPGGRRVLAVAANPAVDVTYDVDGLSPGHSHRVQRVQRRGGGKAVNVARVLLQLGVPVHLLSCAGGATGQFLREDVAAAGVPATFVRTAAATRSTVTVVARAPAGTDAADPAGPDDAGTADASTIFNEPGPPLTSAEWDEFCARFAAAVTGVDVVVISGSLPTGVPVDAYAVLVEIARAAGRFTVLDTSGPAFAAALRARPDLVKPNLAEAAELLGRPLPDRSAAADAAHRIRRLGAGGVLLSRGPAGALLVNAAGGWTAAAPALNGGNPTGAGDALVAAVTAGIVEQRPWPVLLARAVAVSAAAVMAGTAGCIDVDHARRTQDVVTAHRLDAM